MKLIKLQLFGNRDPIPAKDTGEDAEKPPGIQMENKTRKDEQMRYL